jgi:hypothetical protein
MVIFHSYVSLPEGSNESDQLFQVDPSGIIAAYDQPPHSNCAIAHHPKMRPLPELPESSATNSMTMQYNGLYACQT